MTTDNIIIITGQTGKGKTLASLQYLEKNMKDTKRIKTGFWESLTLHDELEEYWRKLQ